MGKARVVESMQSMTRTRGIVLFVVCVLECAIPVGDWGGERSDSKDCLCVEKRRVEIGIFV
jgi:hypothetical protein